MKKMCKKKFQSPCVCRNELSNPSCLLRRASFTDYSKTTRVRMFYTAYIEVVETNYHTQLIPDVRVNNKDF